MESVKAEHNSYTFQCAESANEKHDYVVEDLFDVILLVQLIPHDVIHSAASHLGNQLIVHIIPEISLLDAAVEKFLRVTVFLLSIGFQPIHHRRLS